MSLFQNSVLNKYLKGLETEKVKEAYEKFTRHFHNPEIQENIRNSKEEQYQGEFLIDLFVNVLGYVKNPTPDFNLTTELKNIKGSKKTDGAILKGEKALAVIELKGTNTTDLSKVETQAFGYKNNQPGCNYVITSNFEKLRFYIDNAVDFEEFNLFQLTKERFDNLWLCLSSEYLLKDIPKKIKDESLTQEDSITKNLYKDYASFRNEIFDSIQNENPEYDKLTLFKKTQKLLDRFLFIFFAEDKLLLPPNSIRSIVNQWTDLRDKYDEYFPLYDRFKKYFGYMNSGHKGQQHDIFAYNGGLFAPDEILDNIKINDDLLYKHTVNLSNYDFESEVGVNILGHIFEHSLNDIDEIQTEIQGTITDKSKTKRKKDGVFYTPKYITKYIVDNTVGKLCEEKKTELDIQEAEYEKERKGRQKATLKKLTQKLEDYRKWLLQITICDPACGSGAFLNQALEFLITEHRYIDELQAKLFGDAMILSEVENSILENNLYGVDINEESVEIAKLSLWLRTAQKGRKLTTLNNNIKCGNSLIDDPNVAGDKAFNWQKEFPKIFKEKEKKAWHITTATHNSRYSQRMFDNHVKIGDAIWLDEKDEIIISETIAEIVKKDNLNVIEYNICGDHMHLLLVCEEDELTKIVGKLKAVSGKNRNIEKGITTRGHVPLSDSVATTEKKKIENSIPLSDIEEENEKKKYNALWTQKFRKSEIKDENYLNNVIEYIRDNRIKHELPKSKKIEKIKKEFLCSKEHANRTEYNGGFDVVIGNPPYLGGRNWKDKDGRDYDYFVNKYQVAEYQFDMYVLFWEKGILLTKKSGVISYITPNTWLNNLKTEKLREYVLNKTSIVEIADYSDIKVFEDAVVLPVIFILKKMNSEQKTKIFKPVNSGINLMFSHEISQSFWNNEDYKIINIRITEDEKYLNQKIEHSTNKLADFATVKFGIKLYETGKGNPPQLSEFSKTHIYEADYKVDDTYRRFLDGKSINTYWFNWSDKWLKYGVNLAAPREKELFEGDRLLVRRITGKRLISTYINENYVTSQLLQIVKPFKKNDTKWILAILNSSLIAFYFKRKYNRTDKAFPEIRIYELRDLPIKLISIKTQQPFIEKANQMLDLNKSFQQKKSKFLNRLKDNLGATAPVNGACPIDLKLSKKLEVFYNYDFKIFVSELKKKKVVLSLLQQDEWEEYFNSYKTEINQLQAEIDKTDKEIDQMVYELYGLTEDEIKIVEKATA